MSRLVELQKYGQSVWLDNIRRGLIASGELKRLIEEDGLRGVTSNPTIFEKAIAGSTDYDEAMRKLVDEGKSVNEIYEALVLEDIRMAADLFLPVFEATDGQDGFVSLEVSPKLAYDTEGTIAEARRLWRLLERQNVMIKVPATPEGLPAIEQLIGEGININVTLLFSIERYEQVAQAYIAGLEKRADRGDSLDRVASVASFFLSRIDTVVDRILEARLRDSKDAEQRARLEALLGKAAIASAKLAYQRFKEIFSSPRFLKLKRKGARVQRILWASTSTKNPHHRDVRYVEELIGPDTVNTMPPTTLDAFRDHGRPRASLEENVEEARKALEALAEVGIVLDQTARQLQDEGVKAFSDSFDQLMRCIASKREMIRGGLPERQILALGHYRSRVEATLDSLSQQQFIRRLWSKDASLWKQEPEHQKIIQNRLGWLTLPEWMVEHCEHITDFADEVRNAGFKYALLLGMGGSSLAPEVLRQTFGTRPGYLDLAVLDSTDPATILSLERSVDLAKTLFIISTKSGTTVETLSLYEYFYEKVRGVKGDRAAENFIAITDAETPLARHARDRGFLRVFLNPPDIGGRYSALSYFGLVPAALMGIDIETLLDRAERLIHACVSCVPVKDNPCLVLGSVLGELGKEGRDKITLILSPPIETFGYWVEQLIAESTGKEGKGLVPVEGEPLGAPSVYGDDRLFVYIRLDDAENADRDATVQMLEKAGHPIVRILLREPMDLGQEFFRWEMATAIASARLGVNAFDEPNVQESKDNTKRLLEEYRTKGELPSYPLLVREGNIGLYGDQDMRVKLSELGAPVAADKGSLAALLAGFLKQARPGDYLAVMAYLQRSTGHHGLLQSLRTRLRDGLRVATTLGYGPRFLHSTGQLHKGGANNGLFIQITADDSVDLPIPGQPYTFSVLKQAQALGDFLSLSKKGRRVIRFHLGHEVEAGLRTLLAAVEEALGRLGK
ncbi:Transaldolase [bacterium HR10]|uniref:Transaldolase n=1 Tax=uncultured Acidobacteriota bacterium TaxID=171953 RepID=H5SG43_9BACT|nr:bifunctional transaldolase / phosphoglucose isomerase [uncultured Acidobacteriota bacterium]GBC81569.1 Transaldolase [bacterium HR10]